ncbi:bax inhibitor family protein [Moniliophthora roreri MCA 2997]|uniref:Bax inhibitor family protein n=1 Tax=Moniliophthora roreri (strain MCA 2997) TaxID=1381753 RepID=V2X927_MONRO|nr:bax inhibitor family protein [Moniliophthora roreri MCA 2997]
MMLPLSRRGLVRRPTQLPFLLYTSPTKQPTSNRFFSNFYRPKNVRQILKQQSKLSNLGLLPSGRRFIWDGRPGGIGEFLVTLLFESPYKSLAFVTTSVIGTVVILAYNPYCTGDPTLPEEASIRIRRNFVYYGSGILLTAISSLSVVILKRPTRIPGARSCPWFLYAGGMLGGTGAVIGIWLLPAEDTLQKHALWGGLNLCQGVVVSSLYLLSPALFARVAICTLGTLGTAAIVGATAKDKSLNLSQLASPSLSGFLVLCFEGILPGKLGLGGIGTLELLPLYVALGVVSGLNLQKTKSIEYSASISYGTKEDPISETLELSWEMAATTILYARKLLVRLVGSSSQ